MPERRWILLAEDNDDDASLVSRGFRGFSDRAELVRARDGIEAIEIMASRAESPPAVALLDLKMPRMGGIEVLNFMRRHTRLSCVPVVVLTSSDEPGDVRAAQEGGCTAYLTKPVDFESYMTLVDATMRFWLSSRTT
ncbi:response regulator [Fimbriimonas ginsengisoli]|uniref:Two component signal transduction response regulator n=1 Tax=Fimbriimonas ginsengisoli Gsoil 348 TaxID=661478 RepID=A0A068NPA2_FIMGI|nr:response regulator [Fimbriimonas ginsengisoli]AIE85281.1 two component signal transduction response regulator [Fimbriimonas ginsengisoli Gsoil 348]